ncbi:opine dehydrogenase-like isoform X2 [Saccostrea echinata]|nr:opine dehydrogenase-like isoform X2 [Saccostrea echinata]
MMGTEDKLKVLICGGGNGAHCLAGLSASKPEHETRVLTLYADEAERWTKILQSDDLTVTIMKNDGSSDEVKSKPSLITKDPKAAVTGADVIFLIVPAFAHEQYFREISPFVGDNTVIVGLPGQAGFEFQCLNMLGEKSKTCTIMSAESLPWACRILEFGRLVQILGVKETLGVSKLQGSQSKLKGSPFEIVQNVLGPKPVLREIQNYIAVNLMAKSIIHPPLMYGKWSTFDGTPLNEKPLFYQGVDEKQAKLLSDVSDECIAIGKAIEKQIPGMDMSDVIHIFDWFLTYYADQITDKTNLMMAMQTNKAYDGLLHPMKEVGEGQFVPDFTYRYTAEDIPFGLVVMKGIGQLAGVPTPVMDEIITWAQDKLNQEYLTGSELTGKDVSKTRAPQRFGFKSLQQLFDF